jgi:predicted RNA polymerase sigma factor
LEYIMAAKKQPAIALPKSWAKHVRAAMLHVVSLAQYATAYTRSWAADSTNGRLRIKSENDRSQQEVVLLREEMRIKDARMALINPHRRPYYPPVERMSILELRAARGWSLQQAAEAFLVTAATIASWMKRLDEEGPQALVQLREPVNKFPELVRYAVRRLKTLCPTMGKAKIAQMLCRAGLHLGTTTVGRMLKENPQPVSSQSGDVKSDGRVVTAKRPNHV